MAGYEIGDVPSIELSSSEKELLSSLGADAVQSELMSEAIIAVSEHDEVIGPISKIAAHQNEFAQTPGKVTLSIARRCSNSRFSESKSNTLNAR